MDAALHVFARDGLGFARHAEIAKRAGVALATVFHYFPTRPKLVEDVLSEVDRFFIDRIIDPLDDQPDSAPVAITKMLMTFADLIDSHPAYAQIWLEWSTAVRDEIWASYLRFYEQATIRIAELVQTGISNNQIHAALVPLDVARIIVGLAHPIAHMKFSGSSRETIERTMQALVGNYLQPDPTS